MAHAIVYPHITKEHGKPARLESHPRVRDAEITAELEEVDRLPQRDARSQVWLKLKAREPQMASTYQIRSGDSLLCRVPIRVIRGQTDFMGTTENTDGHG